MALPFLIWGGLALLGTIALIVIIMDHINRSEIQKELEKREIYKAKIKDCLTEGNMNEIHLDTYDDDGNKIKEMRIEGSSVDDDIYKGLVIYS